MRDIPVQSISSVLTPDEFNDIPSELENAITSSGISLSSSDLNQLAKSIINMVANGNYYLETGSANAYVCSQIGSMQAPTAYTNGMLIRFRATNANSGASTVNVASLGIKNIKQKDGSTDLTAGMITTTEDTWLIYDGTSFRLFSLGTLQISKLFGNIIGDVYASNGTSKVLENGTDGTDAVFDGTALGTFKRIRSTELSAVATEIELTGLDGAVDEEYLVKVYVIGGGATVGEIYLKINDDNTTTNYFWRAMGSVGSTAYTNITENTFYRAGYSYAGGFVSFADINIKAKSGESRIITSQETVANSNDGINTLFLRGGLWRNQADNIVKIKIVAEQTDGLGIGTKIELYARR